MKFVDLQAQYKAYQTDLEARMSEVLTSCAFIMGPHIKELEKALSDYIGATYAVSCASGTDALLMALMAYDLQPGDEVITTPFTFISTAEVIALLKAKPVFVDVDEKTFNIDPQKIEKAITERTKAIIPVDLFGQCADYDQISAIAKKYNIVVIEDAAQSFGAQYKDRMAGSLADIGCTSFFPAKPFGCYGDGGMIFTNDEEINKVLTSLRVHGKGSHKYQNVRIGINGRLDTLQAAILLAKFKHFPDEIKKRDEIAQYYTESLAGTVDTPTVLEYNFSAWAQYSIIVKNRDAFQSDMKEQNIPTAIYYPRPLHLQEAFAYLGYKMGDFPVSENLSEHIISLPMHPFLERSDQDQVIECIKSFHN